MLLCCCARSCHDRPILNVPHSHPIHLPTVHTVHSNREFCLPKHRLSHSHYSQTYTHTTTQHTILVHIFTGRNTHNHDTQYVRIAYTLLYWSYMHFSPAKRSTTLLYIYYYTFYIYKIYDIEILYFSVENIFSVPFHIAHSLSSLVPRHPRALRFVGLCCVAVYVDVGRPIAKRCTSPVEITTDWIERNGWWGVSGLLCGVVCLTVSTTAYIYIYIYCKGANKVYRCYTQTFTYSAYTATIQRAIFGWNKPISHIRHFC